MFSVSWTMLVLLLSTTGTLGAVNEAWLTRVVEIIRTEYGFKDQFCIAVNIPEGANPNSLLSDFLRNDLYQTKVKDVLTSGGVYKGQSVVAASYSEDEQAHAETRVLEAMQDWNVETQGNFLIFYTYLSPCAKRCANVRDDRNILDTLAETLPFWGDRVALVFGRPCTRIGQTGITGKQIEQSLQNLAKYGFGQNIFRCYRPAATLNFGCFPCFSARNTRDVANQCVVDSEEGRAAGGKREPYQGPSCSTDPKRGRGSTGTSSRGRDSRSQSRSLSRSPSSSRGGSLSESPSYSRRGSFSSSRSGSLSRSPSRSRSGGLSRSPSRSRSGSPRRGGSKR